MNIFGSIYRKRMILNDFGEFAREKWIQSCDDEQFIQTDVSVIMPNHVHAILVCRNPTPNYSSVTGFLYSFQQAVTDHIGWFTRRPLSRSDIWEETYSVREIMCLDELEYLRSCVMDEPGKWWEDELKPRIHTGIHG